MDRAIQDTIIMEEKPDHIEDLERAYVDAVNTNVNSGGQQAKDDRADNDDGSKRPDDKMTDSKSATDQPGADSQRFPTLQTDPMSLNILENRELDTDEEEQRPFENYKPKKKVREEIRVLDWMEVEARVTNIVKMQLLPANEQRKHTEKTLETQGALLSKVDQRTTKLQQVVFYKDKNDEQSGNIFNYYQEKIT